MGAYTRWTPVLALVLFNLPLGCCLLPKHQREAAAPPKPCAWYPEWAYDAPFYFKPAAEAELKPLAVARGDGDTEHYYTNKRLIEIVRPENGVTADRAPRLAVYWSDTQGYYWQRSGYFGLGQTHFAMPVKGDGDYGIRFVGPGLPPSPTKPTAPHRIYHVDTRPPRIAMTVRPEQDAYAPGEVVTIEWTATDANPAEQAVRVAVSRDGEDSWEKPGGEPRRGSQWKLMPAAFADEGALAYTIPDDTAGRGIRLHVIATDRAGNVGRAESSVLNVAGSSERSEKAAPVQAFAPVRAPRTKLAAVPEARLATSGKSAGDHPGFVSRPMVQLAMYEPLPPEHLASRTLATHCVEEPVAASMRNSVSVQGSPLLRLAKLPARSPGQRYGLQRPWESLDRSAKSDRMTWRLPGAVQVADARR